MSEKIDLSIIIVSVNTKKILEDCLNSIKPAISGINAEVVVVDSGSTDGTFQMLTDKFSWVKLIKKSKIRDFGENNNTGIKTATGRYILLLNSDTKILDNKIFSEMIDYLDDNPKIGIASCALLNADQKSYQGSGGYFPTFSRVINWMFFIDNFPFFDQFFKSYHPNLNYFSKIHNQDWITGAFFLTRKDILDKIGGFDEHFNAYVEEVDLSYRIKSEEYEVWYLPNWKIIHFGGMSYGSENSIIFEIKNLKFFYIKHYPRWQLPLLNLIIKFGCILRIIVFGLFRPSLAKIYVKAIKTI